MTKKDTEATTSCLLLHHTRRRLYSGGNDLSLSVSISHTLCTTNFTTTTTTLSKICALSHIYRYMTFRHIYISVLPIGRKRSGPVLYIFHLEGHVSQQEERKSILEKPLLVVWNHPRCLTLIGPIFHYAHMVPKGSESIRRKTLSHSICNIIGCRYLLEANFPRNDTIPNEVISSVFFDRATPP